MELFCAFFVNIENLLLYFQKPKRSHILGFQNFKAALNAQNVHYSDSGPGPGPEAGFKVASSQKRPIPPSPTPSIPDSDSDTGNLSLHSPTASALPKIPQDFYESENGEGDEIPNICSELGGEADDEIDEEADCSEHEEDIPRKAGKRYTGLDFEFLQEDWLDCLDGSSEDRSTCSD
jgi:hypothetical protein